jgi:hypothetical protein
MINDLDHIIRYFVYCICLFFLNYLLEFYRYNKHVELCLSTDISQREPMFSSVGVYHFVWLATSTLHFKTKHVCVSSRASAGAGSRTRAMQK